jgi:hypothetical protein
MSQGFGGEKSNDNYYGGEDYDKLLNFGVLDKATMSMYYYRK